MSNSAKQGVFIDRLIRALRQLGCQVELDRGKHYKIRLSRDGQSTTIPASTTPSNRHAAQRATLGDVRRALETLGIPRDTFDTTGLVQMLRPGQGGDVDLERLYKALRENEDFPERLAREIVEIGSVLSIWADSVGGGRVGRNRVGGQMGASQSPYAILSPEGQPGACRDFVGVYLVEGRNSRKRFTAGRGLDALIDYYASCLGIVKVGLVISETWNPATLRRFEIPIKFFESMGIRTIFLLRNGQALMPMRLPWQ